MYINSSVNTRQNQAKFCTMEVQVDVQFAMTKVCMSVNRKYHFNGHNIWSTMRNGLSPSGPKVPTDSDKKLVSYASSGEIY